MPCKLGDIADVQMGRSFRSRVEPEKDGEVRVIRMSNFADNNRLHGWSNFMKVSGRDIEERHFVRWKDLIFRSRGKTTIATMVDTEMGRTIVAAPLLRIRIKSGNVLPEYLCWFINQPLSQAFLHSRATGTAMVMIGKSALDALEIPVPGIANQNRIAAIAGLWDKEQSLMADLAKAREKLNNKILMRLATESERLEPTGGI